MSEQRYKIELTERQAQEIQRALEAVFRMGIGQPENALSYCRDAKGANPIWWEHSQQVEQIIKPLMGLEPNQGWGVGRFEGLDLLWEMSAAIRYRLSWDRARKNNVDAKDCWQVCYDEPMSYTSHPKIQIQQHAPDDNEPITEEWLKTFAKWIDEGRYQRRWEIVTGKIGIWEINESGEWLLYEYDSLSFRTRGQLRSFCKSQDVVIP